MANIKHVGHTPHSKALCSPTQRSAQMNQKLSIVDTDAPQIDA